MMNILTVEGVAKSYGTRVLFDDVTFAVDGGQKLGLIGLNGAGKTTLLKIIAGMAEADKGNLAQSQGPYPLSSSGTAVRSWTQCSRKCPRW